MKIYKDTDVSNEGDEKLLNWAEETLETAIKSYFVVAETPYSRVIKIETKDECYFLKHTPFHSFYSEAHILEKLCALSPVLQVPKLIARSDSARCYLMNNAGSLTLRRHLDDTKDLNLIHDALYQYFKIQDATKEITDNFLALGVPDWTVERFINRYVALVQNDYYMSLWCFGAEEQSLLISKQEVLKKYSHEMSVIFPVNTLNHCDFHTRNIVVHNGDGKLSIIDWAETCIASPLLSIDPLMRSLRKHHHFEKNSFVYKEIQNQYFYHWGVSPDLIRPYIDVLGPVYFIFCMQNLIEITGNDFKPWVPDVQNAFKDLLSRI